jgi:hypothetical protein
MNIVFAFHKGDSELAVKSSEAIAAMGFNMQHKATTVCPHETPHLEEITNNLKKVFPQVGHIVATSGFEGWPLGPNQLFADASVVCCNETDPWYFWEPDCVPMRAGWADELMEEYRYKPAIVGDICEGGMAANGMKFHKTIIGSAVYPPNLFQHCPLAENLSNYNLDFKIRQERNLPEKPEPWDVYCRHEFLRIGRATPLIKTYWKSVNYQWRNGNLVFFAADPDSQQMQSVMCPDRTVSDKAAVVHGCKDGSLHTMAIAGFPKPTENVSENVVPKDHMGIPVVTIPPAEPVVKYTKTPVKRPKKQKIKRGKMIISDAERQRRSENMKRILADRRANASGQRPLPSK